MSVYTATFRATTKGITEETVGGKGANLIEMAQNDLPVPDGYIVTANAYREFVQQTGIEAQLVEAVDIDTGDTDALTGAAETASELILNTEIPNNIADKIVQPYSDFIGDRFVAVRSSATAEDMADASFAGQYSTFLNVRGTGAVLDRIKKCWASLFNERAIYYRVQNDISHDHVDMAVVIQEMVPADKSGVMFTANPSTGEQETIVEAGYGLGEAIVSGEISPDKYVVDPESGERLEQNIKTQELMYAKHEGTGKAIQTDVPDERQDTTVLDETELQEIVELGRRIENHYDVPQDIEWCIAGDELFVVQSRPITTTDETTEVATAPAEKSEVEGDKIAEGTGVASGRATGHVVFSPIEAVKMAHNEDKDVILVRKMTSPSDIQGMKTAVGILTSAGGTTSHAAIVARELDKPTVVGCEDLSIDYDQKCCEAESKHIEKDDLITIDADSGSVFSK